MTNEHPGDERDAERPSTTDAPSEPGERGHPAREDPAPGERDHPAPGERDHPAPETREHPASDDEAPERPTPSGEPRPPRARGRGARRLLGRFAGRLALRRTPAPPRVARVFDGQRDGTPWFASDHPVIVDGRERDAILALLRSGSVLVHAARPLRDDLAGVDAAVPADLRSDGSWIWSDASAYYLERHWIAPDAGLVEHLRTARPAAPIDAETWRRLSAAIRPDAWEGTAWPLD